MTKKAMLLAGIAMLLASCTNLEREIGCEVQPVDPAWNPVVAPFYHRDRIAIFQTAMRQSSSEIQLVDVAEFWQTLFRDRDPGAGVNISEFRHSDVAIQASALGVRHVVVLDTLPITEPDSGEGVLSFIYESPSESSSQGAVMVTFTGASCDMSRYLAKAEGHDPDGWFYLGYHLDADAPNEALRAVTDRMAEIMLERSPERPVKVVVLAAKS
jgi:hypothetical protein